MRIHVRKQPFQIIATKPLLRRATADEADLITGGVLPGDNVTDVKVVWQSKPSGILYSGKASIIEVDKPGRARYLGQSHSARGFSSKALTFQMNDFRVR